MAARNSWIWWQKATLNGSSRPRARRLSRNFPWSAAISSLGALRLPRGNSAIDSIVPTSKWLRMMASSSAAKKSRPPVLAVAAVGAANCCRPVEDEPDPAPVPVTLLGLSGSAWDVMGMGRYHTAAGRTINAVGRLQFSNVNRPRTSNHPATLPPAAGAQSGVFPSPPARPNWNSCRRAATAGHASTYARPPPRSADRIAPLRGLAACRCNVPPRAPGRQPGVTFRRQVQSRSRSVGVRLGRRKAEQVRCRITGSTGRSPD